MLQAQGKVCREAYEKIAAKMEDIIEELEEAVTTAAETAALRVHHAMACLDCPHVPEAPAV